MKHEKISIKWKVFIYLLSFTGLLLILLWLFQTVYLDVFYKTVKRNDLDNAMEDVVSILQDEENDDDEIMDALDSISDSYDISIDVANKSGVSLYNAGKVKGMSILQPTDIVEYYQQAKENDGEVEVKPTPEDMYKNPPGDSPEGFVRNKIRDFSDEESVLLVKVIEDSDGYQNVILLNSLLTPVDATVYTLRIQLMYISAILVILSLIIALMIAKRVSRSIIKINTTAKEMAQGNFNVIFNGKDYKEIAELSDTLNYTAEELAKTENLQRELIANVSHDLRTPLTMVSAYAEVMRDIPGENTPENVQVIIDEANRLTNLVNDLLDISKLQSGVSTLDIKEFDLTESIKSIINRYAKLVEQNGYFIDFEFESNITVKADEFKIYQVIYNFVNNAINYTGEDKTVKVKQIVNGNIVRIEVSDSGIGIDESEIPYVWERYYKVDKNHKRAVMGTGLGLSIVKNILKLHNAKYGVNSVVGKGSTFWFELKITH